MKKLILAVVSVALLTGAVSFVNAKDSVRDDVKKAIEEMETLVEKYNKASDKKKPAIEKQIKEKVAKNYENHLKKMEERTAQLEEKVAKMKEEIKEMKTDEAKTKQVDKITKEILDGKKPMLFQPPWAKDGKFDKHGKGWRHGHKGMKGFKHHNMKGAKCQEEKNCPFAKEDVHHFEGDNLPPQPMPDQI